MQPYLKCTAEGMQKMLAEKLLEKWVCTVPGINIRHLSAHSTDIPSTATAIKCVSDYLCFVEKHVCVARVDPSYQ